MDCEEKEARLHVKENCQNISPHSLHRHKKQNESLKKREENGNLELDVFIPKSPLSSKSMEFSENNGKVGVEYNVEEKAIEKEDSPNLQTSRSNASSFLKLSPKNGSNEPFALASSSSSDPPGTSQTCTVSFSSLTEAVVAGVLMSEDNPTTNQLKASGSDDDIFTLSKSANSCDTIPVEKQSTCAQVSIKTEEIFTNSGERQFLSTSCSPSNYVETSAAGDGVKNGEKFQKCSPGISALTNNLKEVSAVASVKDVKDHTQSASGKEKRRGRRKQVEFGQKERVFVADDGRDKGKISEISGFNEAEQQTHSCPSDGVGPQRMKRKVYEHRRTMQTRSSSGSLPKTSRARVDISADNELRQGFGVKKLHCDVCKVPVTQRKLKRHMLEMHGGQPSSNKAPHPPLAPTTFRCPLCHLCYKGKHCLKRHFANKHLDRTAILCDKSPQCKFKAKTLSGYLKHIEKHKRDQTKALNPPQIQKSQPHNLQLQCRECFELFQSSDALGLHAIDHKINSCLSQAQSASHASHPTSSTSNLELPQELKLQVKHSLNSVIKLTSYLESLACPLNSSCSPLVCSTILPAVNRISSLSSELANLSATLYYVLIHHIQMNNEEGKVSVDDDPVEKVSYNEGEVKEEGSEVILPRNQEIVKENDSGELQDLVLGKDSVVTEAVDGSAVKVEESVMDTSVKSDVLVNSFGTKVKRNENLDVAPTVSKAASKTKEIHSRIIKQLSQRDRIAWKKMLEKHKPSKFSHNYKCQECGKNLKNFVGLRRHLMIHRDLRPHKCGVCDVSFRRPDHLKKHMVVHSEERPFKCDVCSYCSKTAKGLHTHSLTHGKYPCQKCSYKGRTSYELSKHEKKHSPCFVCNYVASDATDYKIHKRSHLVYSCSECSYSCYTSWQLRRHSKTHNPSSEEVEKFCCELCGYSCVRKKHFMYHMERHENKTPFSCSVCDYKCSSRTSFDAHKLMHAGLRPFLCSFCGASFRRSSHLNNHMLIHNDEKKHVCRTCGRPFRARHNLKVHEMIHTGERKYKCQLCSFACRRNRELRMHMARHKVLDGKDKDSKSLQDGKDKDSKILQDGKDKDSKSLRSQNDS